MKATRQSPMRYEYPVLGCGLALAMFHIVDFAFVHRGPGATADFWIAVVISLLLLTGYQWLSLWLRALVAILCGSYVAIQGLVGHVLHILGGSAAGADYSGVLYAAGGTVILGLGIVLAVRLREDG